MIVEILAGFSVGLWVGIAYCAREKLFDVAEKCRSFKGHDLDIRLSGVEARVVRLEESSKMTAEEISLIEDTIRHIEMKHAFDKAQDES